MDTTAFHRHLRTNKLSEAEIGPAVAIAERFDRFLRSGNRLPSADTAWAFSRLLIEEGNNTEANYRGLIRYCRFAREHEMFIAFLELVDGGEVGANLFRMVGERFGVRFRDEVFAGFGIPPYGTPSPDKPALLQPIIERIRLRLGERECGEFLSACLRDLPDEHFVTERDMLEQAGSIDVYLIRRKERFVQQLEECQREGKLFFAQEITPEVLDHVRLDPEMGGGRRDGNVVYETKIPYMTRQYLAATDPVMKRYYACHCPWARDAIKNGDVPLRATFCHCSGGFHKKPLEAAFGQSLRVDVLESALKGDERCRFAIHLPESALEAGR